ncbi:MAG: hypothetical protein PHI99_09520, partial [Syntrophales bacterium]|nr:hypothetical protein [Syntrophales bacterium]
EINLLGLELVSINKRLEEIETALAVESRTVWCVDYSTALTGSVGTIEINGEADAINIMPGGATGAGLLQHPLAMTPSGVFVNSAKLPAWQKWMPTYRAGVITSISGDTCNVALDAALSSAQSIDINQADALTNVTIKYMTCDGLIFQVGDHVVVQFVGQSQSSPKVVGFVDNPRNAGYTFTFTGPYALSSEAGAACYYLKDGELEPIKCDNIFKDGTLYVFPLYTTYDSSIPHTTPLYVQVESQYCCLRSFGDRAEYMAGGVLPFGKYVMDVWGKTDTIERWNSIPDWDNSYASLPFEASRKWTISSNGPYVKSYSADFEAAGFDVYGPGGQWAAPLWDSVDTGEISFGGWIYGEPAGETMVTINQSVTVTKWKKPLTGESGTFDDGYGWLRDCLAAGAPIYLDTNACFKLSWANDGYFTWKIDKSPTMYAPPSKVRSIGDQWGFGTLSNAYAQNTTVAA